MKCNLYKSSSTFQNNLSLIYKENNPWRRLVEYLRKLIDRLSNQLPIFDTDKDKFSSFNYLRGSNWRGRDCNDNDDTVYPGRKTFQNSKEDHNCNGIKGVDTNNIPYDTKFCSGENSPIGTIVLGDSASANFRKIFHF